MHGQGEQLESTLSLIKGRNIETTEPEYTSFGQGCILKQSNETALKCRKRRGPLLLLLGLLSLPLFTFKPNRTKMIKKLVTSENFYYFAKVICICGLSLVR